MVGSPGGGADITLLELELWPSEKAVTFKSLRQQDNQLTISTSARDIVIRGDDIKIEFWWASNGELRSSAHAFGLASMASRSRTA
jgi:hypothetical protein